MKVIDGKFGSKEEDEELTLWQKVSLAMSSTVSDEDLGNFVLITDTGDGTLGIIADMDTGQAVYLLELAKLNLIMNADMGDTLH